MLLATRSGCWVACGMSVTGGRQCIAMRCSANAMKVLPPTASAGASTSTSSSTSTSTSTSTSSSTNASVGGCSAVVWNGLLQ